MLYFMRSAQFYAKRFSSWTGLAPKVWVCGTRVGAGELARQRPIPVPQTHSSLRSGSLDMTIFLFLQ